MRDVLYVSIVILAIGTVLWCRRQQKTGRVRVAPYRESLVPENFWTSCIPAVAGDRITLLWILREYLPETRSGSMQTIHDINRYFFAQGIEVVVVVPESPVGSYDDIRILQFHQRFEIEVALRRTRCICTQNRVIEAAAQTAKGARKPLIIFSRDDTLEPDIKLAKKITDSGLYLVNCNQVLDRVYRSLQIPSFVIGYPIFWKEYNTHTTREYITIFNIDDTVAPLFYRIARQFPEYKFLGVRSYGDNFNSSPPANLTLMNFQEDVRAVYAETGIFCIISPGSGRAGLEAGSSGIPIIACDTLEIKEALGDGAIYADPEDDNAWVGAIIKLRRNAFFYQESSKAAFNRVKELQSAKRLDELKVFLEEA